MSSGIGQQIYDNVSEFGKFKTFLGLILGIILFIVLFSLSVYFLIFNRNYNKKLTTAIVLNINNCEEVKVRDMAFNSCMADIEYVVDNKRLAGKIKVVTPQDFTSVKVGDTINIEYLIRDPKIANHVPITNTSLSLLILCVGATILGFTYLAYYLAERFKIYAAFEGGTTLFNLISLPFR
jgi:hypothetical protein